MRLSRDQLSSGQLTGGEAGGASPPARGRRTGRVGAGYVRVAGPVLRGPAGVVAAVVFFTVAGAVGGRAGLIVASGYLAVNGAYCLLNFLHCRETHCGVTGPGFLLAALLGFAAVLVPGSVLSWYRAGIEAAVFLAVLGAGYGLEHVVAARTGRRALR